MTHTHIMRPAARQIRRTHTLVIDDARDIRLLVARFFGVLDIFFAAATLSHTAEAVADSAPAQRPKHDPQKRNSFRQKNSTYSNIGERDKFSHKCLLVISMLQFSCDETTETEPVYIRKA